MAESENNPSKKLNYHTFYNVIYIKQNNKN